ncbi:hypothetical protein R1flu_002234 [Riccia fluitans]|uniref:Uncharacterized protein n=1 Tax=Riccia fluitans TaxID=41844 RepID=A0ABD1Y6J2_9MARC
MVSCGHACELKGVDCDEAAANRVKENAKTDRIAPLQESTNLTDALFARRNSRSPAAKRSKPREDKMEVLAHQIATQEELRKYATSMADHHQDVMLEAGNIRL